VTCDLRILLHCMCVITRRHTQGVAAEEDTIREQQAEADTNKEQQLK